MRYHRRRNHDLVLLSAHLQLHQHAPVSRQVRRYQVDALGVPGRDGATQGCAIDGERNTGTFGDKCCVVRIIGRYQATVRVQADRPLYRARGST